MSAPSNTPSPASGPVPAMLRLPAETVMDILRYFVPAGALTITLKPHTGGRWYMPRRETGPRRHVIESRAALRAACQAWRALSVPAQILLYSKVIITDCRGLLYFFRTICTAPDLRRLVVSFAWLGQLPTSSLERSMREELHAAIVAARSEFPRPFSENDAFIHSFTRTDSPYQSLANMGGLLGAVLCMVPDVTCLHLTTSRVLSDKEWMKWLPKTPVPSVGTPREREKLYWNRQTTVDHWWIDTILKATSKSGKAPLGFRFLPNLESLVVDSLRNEPPCSRDPMRIVGFLAQLCPQLRFIHIDDGYLWGKYLKSESTGESISKLVAHIRCDRASTYSGGPPHVSPKVIKLQLDFLETERGTVRTRTQHLKALMRLGSLDRLDLTVTRIRGVFEYFNNHGSSLIHDLGRMGCLQHLQIDFATLVSFGDKEAAWELGGFLPDSLVTLSLINLWRSPLGRDEGGFHLACFIPSRDIFFSPSPDFLRLILSQLLEIVRERRKVDGLPNLRDIKMRSKNPNRFEDHWASKDKSGQTAREQFRQLGIDFVVADLEKEG
ncbi:hypothetical protein B0T26DRAFT_753813 [Lasiosphaeria miniovina]|uniref:Uncharacterized protein n=1 Tax=Lasiosphaeria miniovina TaxID=1954250 RepID=A0AA40ADB8_9PEZI|nr:uncharacterized protein B0T26DRAFT_753813 [Lasiosphaeria miniovina]KAK0713725.1 hypothetical protein B0T26DRAFT_753813 [Lasiosphaeria miniovina]